LGCLCGLRGLRGLRGLSSLCSLRNLLCPTTRFFLATTCLLIPTACFLFETEPLLLLGLLGLTDLARLALDGLVLGPRCAQVLLHGLKLLSYLHCGLLNHIDEGG
jgi:hypothetical protein